MYAVRICACLLLLSLPALAGDAAALPSSRLVGTEWLEQRLDDPSLRVVDMRNDVRDYWRGHIPGAVFLQPDALKLPDRGVPMKPMPPDMLAQLLGRMGIDRNTTVIIYAAVEDSLAPCLLWQLDYLGHPRSAVLSGGFDKWRAEGRPTTQVYPGFEPREYKLPEKLNEAVRATRGEVEQVVEQGGAVLLDNRPRGLYTGTSGPWLRKGRIPGAISRPWTEDLGEGGMLKDPEVLREAYAGIGVTPDQPVILYCSRGLRTSNTYFVLKHVLGYPDVKVYDGSFNEWSNITELPVETGAPE